MHLLDFLVYVDAHQELQKNINAACMLATASLAVVPFFKRSLPARFSFLQRPWLFILVVAISLFACRYPAFFFPKILNPDEALFLSEGITYETHPIPWRDVDSNTSGPLNVYVLLWCVPLGVQPTYFTGRLLELSLLLGMLVFLYLTGRQIAGDLGARVALLPAFAFLCWTAYFDFIHYSSEEVSVFLLSCALYLITRLRRAPGTIFSTLLIGLILGLLPFAKLQSVLLGGFLGLTALWLLFTNRQLTFRAALIRIVLVVMAAAAPAAMILSIVAQAGAFADFRQSYFGMSQDYVVKYSSWWEYLLKRCDEIAWLLSPRMDIAFPLYLSIVPALVLGLCLVLGGQRITRTTRNWYVWAILFTLASIETVFFSGHMFPHYDFFLLPALTFLLAVSFRVLRLSRTNQAPANATAPVLLATLLSTPLMTGLLLQHWKHAARGLLPPLFLWLVILSLVSTLGWSATRGYLVKLKPSFSRVAWQKSVPLACLLIFFIVPVLTLAHRPNPYRGHVSAYLNQPLSPMDLAILHYRPNGGRIAVWGWAPEFVAETQIPLGVRDGDSIFPNSLQAYYRQRYLRDLRANRPELFLEATGLHNTAIEDPTLYTIDSFPDLAKLIADEYRLVEEIDGMRLFVRRDLPQSQPGFKTNSGP